MSTEHPRTPDSGPNGDEHLDDQQDQWAHAMLAAAAGTIDVDPSSAVPERPRTAASWLVPLAAAVVVALAVGIPVWLHGSSGPSNPPTATPPTTQAPEQPEPSPAVRPVDTTGAVPWSDRTDAKKWTPQPGSGPYGDVDPVRWRGLAARLTVPSAADPNSQLVYVVTLRNDGDTDVDLSPCPAFRQTISADPDLNLGALTEYTGRLNCDGLDPIPPGGTQRFVMQLRVPGHLPGAEVSLSWQLVDGPGQDAQVWLPVGQDPVERRWASRTPLPSCGEHGWTKRGPLTEESRAEAMEKGTSCLNRGLDAGTGGEFVLTMTTIEGDPITHYVRATPDGHLEIYYDNTRDRLGSMAWEYASCGTVTEIESRFSLTC